MAASFVAAARSLRAGYMSLAPGILLAGTLALAASYISGSLGGPVMLFALLFGMAFNFLSTNERTRPGLDLASRTILRVGVGLLGVRITVDQVTGLGLETVALVVAGVALTVTVGGWAGYRLGLGKDHAVLSAGAVAICGASAALAISSVLPRHKTSEQQTALTVVGVTTLSTVAMVLYPPLTQVLGFDNHLAGVFLGATIHDVAQVVGSGYMISDETGETATIIKLLRVMCLMPAVLMIGIAFRSGSGKHPDGAPSKRPPLVPFFMLGFVALMMANSFGYLPPVLTTALGEASRWCLLTAVAALGVKTALGELVKVGARPVMVLGIQTAFLGTLVGAILVSRF